MCETNSNLSSSAEIQVGESLLGSVDLKFSPVYEKKGQTCSQGQGEAGAVSGKGFLDSGLCAEVLASSGGVSGDGRSAAEPHGRCVRSPERT